MTKIFIALLVGMLIATVAGARNSSRFSLTTPEDGTAQITPGYSARVIHDAADGRCFLLVLGPASAMAVGPVVPCTP
jgi:hypothetical protein